jgi:hypothetical protein
MTYQRSRRGFLKIELLDCLSRSRIALTREVSGRMPVLGQHDSPNL